MDEIEWRWGLRDDEWLTHRLRPFVQKPFNFSPGPAMLPYPVREALQTEMNYDKDRNPSVVEVSHRAAGIVEMGEDIRRRILKLCAVSHDEYEVLLMPGGARLQFTLLPLNLGTYRVPGYLDSGYWSQTAFSDAERLGQCKLVASAKEVDYLRTPSFNQEAAASCAYLHYCGNESIQGVQYPKAPLIHTDVPLVADLTSEFLTRTYDYRRLGVGYASAQKNFGVAGLTVVLIRRDLLARIPDNLPPYLDYRAWAESESMLNTPCTFAWFATHKYLQWIESNGGLQRRHDVTLERAKTLYSVINQSDFYSNPIQMPYRSRSNVVFFLPDAKAEAKFAEDSEKEGFIGLRGHRAAGGFRASMYNGMHPELAHALADFMIFFEKRYG